MLYKSTEFRKDSYPYIKRIEEAWEKRNGDYRRRLNEIQNYGLSRIDDFTPPSRIKNIQASN